MSEEPGEEQPGTQQEVRGRGTGTGEEGRVHFQVGSLGRERETEKRGLLRSGCGLHCRDVTGDGAGAGVSGEQAEGTSWKSWDPDLKSPHEPR